MAIRETDESIVELSDIVRELGKETLGLLKLVKSQSEAFAVLSAQSEGLANRIARLEEKAR